MKISNTNIAFDGENKRSTCFLSFLSLDWKVIKRCPQCSVLCTEIRLKGSFWTRRQNRKLANFPCWVASGQTSRVEALQIYVAKTLNCETQPPASIAWVALSSVVRRSLSVPHSDISSYLHYNDVLDHTNHIFSVRIWSWQHVSAIHCWVEPSLLLSSSKQPLVQGCQ